MWEAGLLPPKDDSMLLDSGMNLVEVDVMPPIYYHDQIKGFLVVKT